MRGKRPLTLDRWAAHIRQTTDITPTEQAQGDLRAAGFVLLATQALQQRHHGSQPGDPAFEKETVDILGWLQWIIAHRLQTATGPEPLVMVDHQGRRCRMELVGNDWLYRAHPITEGK